MISVCMLVLLVTAATVCVQHARQHPPTLTFLDFYAELRIWWHDWRSNRVVGPYRAAMHIYRSAKLKLARKPAMWEFLEHWS